MTNYSKEKHLEFIQSNIARMNKCSFQMKGWAIAIFSAILALYASSILDKILEIWIFKYVMSIPILICWILDSYYLSIERKFICMYNDVAGVTKNQKVKRYEMPIKKYKGWKNCTFRAMFSAANICLYVAIITCLIVFIISI